LFRVDPDRYQIALRQAEANVEGMQAVAEQKAADYQRYSHLTEAAVSQQKVEEARAADRQAQADLLHAIADRDLAKLNLERSSVRARVNGRVANVTLRPGAYVSVGKGVFALIDSDTLRVEGYFEETKLDNIEVGDVATIQLMGNGRRLQGRVESIAGGIEDRERSDGSTLLANVNPTFSWVRLAQRVPVRIKLDSPSEDLRLVVGRTATVAIESGTAATSGDKH
jgi:RND family efflux transporter MFP subunit